MAKQFDVDAVVADYVRGMESRTEKAAQHAAAALQARIPVEHGEHPHRQPGTMKASVDYVLTKTGFNLRVNDFASWFVVKGHLIGKRSSKRAGVLRGIAKELRRARKETGDDSLKAKETEFRKAAKTEQAGYEQQRAAGKMTKANDFVKATLDAERDNLIAILAGN